MTATTRTTRRGTTTPSTRTSDAGPERSTTYGRQVAGVLVAAFSLSVVHTVYAWVEGLEDPTFTVTTPLTYGFYAVAFAMAFVATRPGRAAQAGVLAFLAVVLGISVFYYPTTFGVEKQTVFGWFENDVYVGLLVVATYLSVLRWRRTVVRPS